MRKIKQIFIKIVAFAFVFLLTQPVCKAAYAEESYEPLEVKLPYMHLYTTTDPGVDSLFHYSVTPEDGAPLPAEADENGIFTFDGTNGSGVKDGNNTVYNLPGELTFTFQRPGIYVYEVAGDVSTDSGKKDADRYTFENRKFKLSFYIANDPENNLKLTMLTGETDEGVKPNHLELDPVYEGPVESETETEVETESETESETEKKSSVTPTSSSNTTPKSTSSSAVKTGDDSQPVFYAVTLVLAALVILVILRHRKKESENHA